MRSDMLCGLVAAFSMSERLVFSLVPGRERRTNMLGFIAVLSVLACCVAAPVVM